MTSSIAITNNISNNGSPLENSSSVVVGINSNNSTTGKGSNEKQLNTIRGPVKTINNNFDYEEAQYANHTKAPCKLELNMTAMSVKKEYIDVAMDKDSQYEEDVVMPTTKSNALNNNKLPEINTMIHAQIGRKARIGKSMAREMIHGCGNKTTAPVVVMKSSVAGLHDTSKTSQLIDLSKLTVKDIKQEGDIKKELNEEDDVVIVEEVSKKETEIKVEPEIVDISSNVSTPPLVVINTDLSQDSSDVEITSYSPPQLNKRIGILSCNNKTIACNSKKSPNGYKSLIKQTEPKSYLVLSRKSDKKDRFGLSKSKTVRRRKLVLTDSQKKRLKVQRKKRKALEKSKLAEKELQKQNQKASASSSGRNSAMDETIDLVARGYFSEPDTSSPKASGRKSKKSKTNEARSKSESKKTTVSSESAKMLISNEQEIRRANKSKEPNSPMEVVDITDSSTIQEDNNNCIKNNNNVESPKPVFDDFKFIEPRVPPLRLTCSKRSRSRSKFGMKSKRSKRSKYLSAGIDEEIIPRRPDVIPKWNNGWTWEGEPFQRKIFLNVSFYFCIYL